MRYAISRKTQDDDEMHSQKIKMAKVALNDRKGLFASMCLQERAMRLQSDKRLRMTASLGLSSA